jgi:hemolysin III
VHGEQPPFPAYTRAEWRADAVLHTIGVTGSAIGAVALVLLAATQDSLRNAMALVVYAVGLAATFACSAGYNLVSRPRLKGILRRLDHCAIFLMIAGTYTPFALIALPAPLGTWMLVAVWSLAVIGVTLKLALPQGFERLAVMLYLAQGWTVLFALGPLQESLSPTALWLLVGGGAVYTAGVVFHLLERLRFHNVVWHAFVLAAACLHYAAVVETVLQGQRTSL